MISTQYIKLNMIPSGVMPVLYCSQYDIGRPLGVVVYNGGEAVNLDTYTCTIEATRTDGTAITAAVTTSNNIGVFVTTATMTNHADRYQVKLVLFDSQSHRVASLAFIMVVTPKTMDENAESIEEDASLYQQYTGTVQSLIADIREDIADINTHISDMYFNTCLEMKASTTLKSGMICQTAGYYAVNDGGGALYRIYSTAPATYYETLSNGLYAELITMPVMSPVHFGAKGDGITDDTVAVQNAINYVDTVDGLGKTYLVRPTELVPGQTTYKAISITKDTTIRNGTFKMDADVERGVCVFGINNSGIITFYNVVIDGNVSAQTVVTGDGANHGIVLPLEGGQGIVRLIGCTVKNCRTDGIVHRAGFLDIDDCTVINTYRNGITCDKSAYIRNSKFDSSQSQTSPNTSIFHEPNEGYGFKRVRIIVENCGFNSGNTGVAVYGGDSTSSIEDLIVKNCYCTDPDGRWRCAARSADEPIYNVLMKDNRGLNIGLYVFPTTTQPTAWMENVVLDGNSNVGYFIMGQANENGVIQNLKITNSNLTTMGQIVFRTKVKNLTLEHCVAGFPEDEDVPSGNDGAIFYTTSAFHFEKLMVKNCTFRHARYGFREYSAQDVASGRVYIIDSVFEDILNVIISTSAKEIYIRGCRTRMPTLTPGSSNYFLNAANLNDFLMASDNVFYQSEAKTWYHANSVNAANCLFGYTEPST